MANGAGAVAVDFAEGKPVPWKGIVILGVYFCVLSALVIYLLVVTWPVSDPKDATKFTEFSVFGLGPFRDVPADIRLFISVIAAGALGSLVHGLTSFSDYVGNDRLTTRWIWWLILRAPIGIALSLLFYLLLRGGLVSPSSGGNMNAALLNPYGVAAISAMAGMFSKQATDKLAEIFDTLFRTREPVARADSLEAAPTISKTEPAKLAVNGPLALKIIGKGFKSDSTVLVNKKLRTAKFVSDTQIELTLLTEDVAAKGDLQLTVKSAGADGRSASFVVPVE